MSNVATTTWTGSRAERGAKWFHNPIRRWIDGAFFRQILSDLPDDATVVDLGAGSGYLTGEIASRLTTGRVIAVDGSQDMLRLLQDKAVAAGLGDRIQGLGADVAATDLPDGSVDVVVSSMLLHEVIDPAAVLREIARLLRPGGQVHLQDLRRPFMWRFLKAKHHPNAYGPLNVEQLTEELRAAGFVEERVVPTLLRYRARAVLGS